ncbi:predicted protein [Plenodomus lingam JN3]|uniref:Predicted protein n=1 Tax=Leptosphaeria maculans (strain JN3 / isolate v23.1.3 / race Av1-4-5-6-7-8) TaxID=985895 RepID=E5A2D3_LEPMJ|nr:predicted protein [Plenodomus lingam JN3]CBX97568.1 predicted protein [Plenodomus lingam JN3]
MTCIGPLSERARADERDCSTSTIQYCMHVQVPISSPVATSPVLSAPLYTAKVGQIPCANLPGPPRGFNQSPSCIAENGFRLSSTVSTRANQPTFYGVAHNGWLMF